MAVSVSATQNFVAGLRAFLRFCFLEGLIERDLSEAALPVTGRRRSLLPRGIAKHDAHALLASCDRRTAIGRRDYAVIINSCVSGCGAVRSPVCGWTTSTGGLASWSWWARADAWTGCRCPSMSARLSRPTCDVTGRTAHGERCSFRPERRLSRWLSGTVASTVRRACRRAGVPEVGAHRLRHTAACDMAVAGVPLPQIAECFVTAACSGLRSTPVSMSTGHLLRPPARGCSSQLLGCPSCDCARLRPLPADHRPRDLGPTVRRVSVATSSSCPYLWSCEDIGRLLDGARALRPLPRAAPDEAVFGLLAVSGISVGEVVGLDRADFNFDTGVITIRHAKFDRPRLVPLHTTTTAALLAYANERDRLCPARRSTVFFVTGTDTGVNRTSVAMVLKQISTAGDCAAQRLVPHHTSCATASPCAPSSTGTAAAFASMSTSRCYRHTWATSARLTPTGICQPHQN